MPGAAAYLPLRKHKTKGQNLCRMIALKRDCSILPKEVRDLLRQPEYK